MRTLNKNSKAALPARLQVTRGGYARYFARSPQQRVALFCSTFIPHRFRRFRFERARVPHWLNVKEHIEHGCLCPAQVVDMQAGLVATFTNLNSRGERSFPAVKIRREPLHLLPDRLKHDGARLAAVSIYHASVKSREAGYWEDFSPLPIDCLVLNEAACKVALRRLSPLAWKALDIGVAQLDGCFEQGLHRVEVPHEIVWNAF